jgi:hypothetical protein
MKRRLRTFNLDDDVIHMLRFKAKNQSRYVNELLRSRLFREESEDFDVRKVPLGELDPKHIVARCFMYTENPLILSALQELLNEVRNDAQN